MPYTYRSPYRPLDLGFLPPDVRASWSYEASDIGEWTPQTRYVFALEIPERFVDQWSLVRLPPVLVIEYQRPNGAPRQIHIDVHPEAAAMAEGMRLECEELMSGHVVLYARWNEQDEEAASMLIAYDGWRAAPEVLAKVIRRHHAKPLTGAS